MIVSFSFSIGGFETKLWQRGTFVSNFLKSRKQRNYSDSRLYKSKKTCSTATIVAEGKVKIHIEFYWEITVEGVCIFIHSQKHHSHAAETNLTCIKINSSP